MHPVADLTIDHSRGKGRERRIPEVIIVRHRMKLTACVTTVWMLLLGACGSVPGIGPLLSAANLEQPGSPSWFVVQRTYQITLESRDGGRIEQTVYLGSPTPAADIGAPGPVGDLSQCMNTVPVDGQGDMVIPIKSDARLVEGQYPELRVNGPQIVEVTGDAGVVGTFTAATFDGDTQSLECRTVQPRVAAATPAVFPGKEITRSETTLFNGYIVVHRILSDSTVRRSRYALQRFGARSSDGTQFRVAGGEGPELLVVGDSRYKQIVLCLPAVGPQPPCMPVTT